MSNSSGYGVITEQGFPYEDTNEGFKNVTNEEAERIETMFKAPEQPSEAVNEK